MCPSSRCRQGADLDRPRHAIAPGRKPAREAEPRPAQLVIAHHSSGSAAQSGFDRVAVQRDVPRDVAEIDRRAQPDIMRHAVIGETDAWAKVEAQSGEPALQPEILPKGRAPTGKTRHKKH